MGGDCSQKLLLRRGLHSSPGRSRSSDQYEIHNSIVKIASLRTRFPGVRRGCLFPGLSSLTSSLSYSRSASIFSLKPVPPRPVSGRRHPTLAPWSLQARRNGSLPRRR